MKNLRRISRTKLILWGLLAVSSIPLHLVYNSVVFSTLSTHSYTVYLVTSGFLSGVPFANSTHFGIGMHNITANQLKFDAVENIQRSILVSKQNEWEELDCKPLPLARFAVPVSILLPKFELVWGSSNNIKVIANFITAPALP